MARPHNQSREAYSDPRMLITNCFRKLKEHLIIYCVKCKTNCGNYKRISSKDFCKILSGGGLFLDQTDRYNNEEILEEIPREHPYDDIINRMPDVLSGNLSIRNLDIEKIHALYEKKIKVVECSYIEVIVKNLIIYTEKKDYLCKTIGLDLYDGNKFKIVDLIFENCIFENKTSGNFSPPNNEFTWKFEKLENSKISFKDCIFYGTCVSIKQRCIPKYRSERMRVEFINTSAYFSTKGITLQSIIDDRRYDIDWLDMHSMFDLSSGGIVIDNCKIDEILIIDTKLSLTRKNVIKRFEYIDSWDPYVYFRSASEETLEELKRQESSIKYEVYWGPYQKVSPMDSDWENHKAWLLRLKAMAEEEHNVHQRDILNREILKCDRELIRREPWGTSWQDRLTLWFNATFSNYGISWIRPLALLTGVNILYSLLVVYPPLSNLCSWEFLHTFLESFNPLYTPELSGEDKKGGMYALLLGAGLLHKLFFAICVYEIIRAARRFSRS